MSKIIFFLGIFLCPMQLWAFPVHMLLDAKGYVCPELRAILKDTGASCEKKSVMPLQSYHIDEVHQAIQGKKNPQWAWFQKGERWEMRNPLIRNVACAKNLIRKITRARCFTVPSKAPNIKGILVLGSTRTNFEARIAALNAYIKKCGEKVPPVYVLTGYRSLIEGESKGLEGVTEEVSLMKALMARDAAAVPYTLIEGETDTVRGRATTATTVKAAIAHGLQGEGTYMVVATPLINGLYQWQSVQNLFDKEGFHATTHLVDSPSLDPDMKKMSGEACKKLAAQALDTLARLLYECREAFHARPSLKVSKRVVESF